MRLHFTGTRIITLIAVLAALANILSLPVLTIPLVCYWQWLVSFLWARARQEIGYQIAFEAS